MNDKKKYIMYFNINLVNNEFQITLIFPFRYKMIIIVSPYFTTKCKIVGEYFEFCIKMNEPCHSE